MAEHVITAENEYEHRFSRICPANGDVIDYRLKIETEGDVIMVETIEEACAGAGEPIFHEVLADILIERFPGRHRLVAKHGSTEIMTRRNRIPVLGVR